MRQGLHFPIITVAAALCMAASAALAHTQNGSLGDAPHATDYYQVTCSDDGTGLPQSLVVQVTHRSAVATSVLAHRAADAVNSTDANGADAAPSPLVFVNGGDGVYNVFVTKAGSGAVNYTLLYHCMTEANGGGQHAGTTLVFRQNQ